jgi:putative acetyltransferase
LLENYFLDWFRSDRYQRWLDFDFMVCKMIPPRTEVFLHRYVEEAIPTVFFQAGNVFNHVFEKEWVFMSAEFNGKIIGTTAVKRIDLDSAEIVSLQIDYRFQGLGLGTILITELLHQIKIDGYHRVVVEVSETQEFAKKLCNKFGFVRYDKEEFQKNGNAWFEKKIE